MKTVFILRSVPGAGKTTLAESLISNNSSSAICCADDYFMHGDEYSFNVEKLGAAHLWCQQTFDTAITNNVEIIVVANTNTYERDVKLYRNKALEHGYLVFVLIVENYHSGLNIHNVPEEILVKMENTIKQNIKLR